MRCWSAIICLRLSSARTEKPGCRLLTLAGRTILGLVPGPAPVLPAAAAAARLPPPPAGTRASSAELYDKVFGSMEAAKAAATAERYENSMHLLARIREGVKELEEGDDASEFWIDYDEDGVEIQRIQ